MATKKIKVILDSNVWRYVVDVQEQDHLRTIAMQSKYQILVPPALVYEAASLQNQALRKKIIDLLTAPYWKRLMPEAFSECEEVRSEIARLRPTWLKPNPNRQWFKRIRYDWLRSNGGFWDRIRNPSEELLELTAAPKRNEAIFENSKLSRAWGIENEKHWKNVDFSNLRVYEMGRANPAPNFEVWRFDTFKAFENTIYDQEHAYFEWLAWAIDFDSMLSDTSMRSFWLYEIASSKMPRNWIRSAMNYRQSFNKVNRGSGADNQIATYLIDADLFISADAGFAAQVEHLAYEAPVGITVAAAKKISGGRDGVEQLFDILS